GDGDMPGNVRTAAVLAHRIGWIGHQPVDEDYVVLEHHHEDDSTEDIEDGMRTSCPHRGSIGTDDSQLCRDGGADVLTDDQSHRGIEVDDPGGGQCNGDAKHGRTALDDDGQQTADGNTAEQAR